VGPKKHSIAAAGGSLGLDQLGASDALLFCNTSVSKRVRSKDCELLVSDGNLQLLESPKLEPQRSLFHLFSLLFLPLECVKDLWSVCSLCAPRLFTVISAGHSPASILFCKVRGLEPRCPSVLSAHRASSQRFVPVFSRQVSCLGGCAVVNQDVVKSNFQGGILGQSFCPTWLPARQVLSAS
jgi:hypothetical protein